MRQFIGLLIILFGLGFLLNNIHIAAFTGVSENIWPALIIVIGLYALYQNRRSWVGPAIIILLGVTMLADRQQWFNQPAWNLFWPAVIILLGLQIIMGRWMGPRMKTSTGTADSFVAFSGVEERKTGTFTGGSSNAWFGGVKLDLREADIQDGAVLNVWAAFGGIDLLVPRNVKVETSVLPLFGGADNKAAPESSAAKTLHVNGTALFGGISIKN